MRSLRRSCAKVCEPSELRFGLVRKVGQGIAVLDGDPRRATGKGDFFWGGSCSPIFYADVAARSIFKTQLPWASASRAGRARAEFFELQARQEGDACRLRPNARCCYWLARPATHPSCHMTVGRLVVVLRICRSWQDHPELSEFLRDFD